MASFFRIRITNRSQVCCSWAPLPASIGVAPDIVYVPIGRSVFDGLTNISLLSVMRAIVLVLCFAYALYVVFPSLIIRPGPNKHSSAMRTVVSAILFWRIWSESLRAGSEEVHLWPQWPTGGQLSRIAFWFCPILSERKKGTASYRWISPHWWTTFPIEA